MLAQKSKSIGGYTYKVTTLPATVGSSVLTKTFNSVGPAFKSADGLGGLETIGSLFEHLKEDTVRFLCDTFSAQTIVTGGDYGSKEPMLSDVFDVHFAGKYQDLLQWLLFCFEVNFSGFFAGLGQTIGQSLPLATKTHKSKSPKA